MTQGNPNRQSLAAPRTLYLLGQSLDTPAERSTNWVVVTAEDEVAGANWDSNPNCNPNSNFTDKEEEDKSCTWMQSF